MLRVETPTSRRLSHLQGVPVLLEDGGWGIADGTSAATVYVWVRSAYA